MKLEDFKKGHYYKYCIHKGDPCSAYTIEKCVREAKGDLCPKCLIVESHHFDGEYSPGNYVEVRGSYTEYRELKYYNTPLFKVLND